MSQRPSKVSKAPLTITVQSPDARRLIDPEMRQGKMGAAPFWGYCACISNLIKMAKSESESHTQTLCQSLLQQLSSDVERARKAMDEIAEEVKGQLSEHPGYNFSSEQSPYEATYPIRFTSDISRSALTVLMIYDVIAFRSYQLKENKLISAKERALIKERAKTVVNRLLDRQRKAYKAFLNELERIRLQDHGQAAIKIA